MRLEGDFPLGAYGFFFQTPVLGAGQGQRLDGPGASAVRQRVSEACALYPTGSLLRADLCYLVLGAQQP